MTRLVLMGVAASLGLLLASAAGAHDKCCCKYQKDACPAYRLMPSPTTLTHTPPPCCPGAKCCYPDQGMVAPPRFYIPLPEQVWARKLHSTCRPKY